MYESYGVPEANINLFHYTFVVSNNSRVDFKGKVKVTFSEVSFEDAIYICLLRLQRKEGEVYYKDWLGKLFQKIYEARKSYKLNRYLDTVTPKGQSESYQQYLNFMWNLSLDEIKNIADYYTKLPEPKREI